MNTQKHTIAANLADKRRLYGNSLAGERTVAAGFRQLFNNTRS